MYIEQAYKGLTDAWRYLVGGVIIFVAWQVIGMIPLGIAIFVKVAEGGDIAVDIPGMVALLGENLFLFLMLLSFAVGLIGVFVSSKLLHKLSIKDLTTTRPKIDWKRFWFIFILWGVVSSSFVLVDYYFLAPEDYVWNFKMKPFLILLAIGVCLLPLQTSFEEYAFRGYGMHAISVFSTSRKFPALFIYILFAILIYFFIDYTYSMELWAKFFLVIAELIGFIVLLSLNKDFYDKKVFDSLYYLFKRKSTALIITSVCFGLLHIANPEVEKLGYVIMVYYIGTGLFLGIITLMDDGLELALGFHAANNLFTALLVTADWTALQTHSVLKDISDPGEMALTEIFVPVLIIFPILLFILSKKYGWTNWKDKLFGQVVEPPNEDYKIIGED